MKPLKTEVAFATPWFQILGKTMREGEEPYYSLKLPDYAAVVAITEDLTARKAITRELGDTVLPEPIALFIDEEFEAARAVFETTPAAITPDAKRDAGVFFRAAVVRFDRTGS